MTEMIAISTTFSFCGNNWIWYSRLKRKLLTAKGLCFWKTRRSEDVTRMVTNQLSRVPSEPSTASSCRPGSGTKNMQANSAAMMQVNAPVEGPMPSTALSMQSCGLRLRARSIK